MEECHSSSASSINRGVAGKARQPKNARSKARKRRLGPDHSTCRIYILKEAVAELQRPEALFLLGNLPQRKVNSVQIIRWVLPATCFSWTSQTHDRSPPHLRHASAMNSTRLAISAHRFNQVQKCRRGQLLKVAGRPNPAVSGTGMRYIL
jgi:hypothetical protein